MVTVGGGLSGRFISVAPADLKVRDLYKLLVGSVVPRPIALVSTQNLKGVGNLAPFSYFNGVASAPPCIMISVAAHRDGRLKDTWINIRDTREFVVNTVSEWMIEQVNATSADFPHGVDEMKKVGLTPLPSVKIKPPRVKESAIQLECRLYDTLQIGKSETPGSTALVVGEIMLMHFAEEVYQNGEISIDNLKPISRLGGLSYGKTREIFDLPRPSADPNG